MIFYLATCPETGRRKVRATQDDIKSVNKDFQKIDVPTDKGGLGVLLQDFYTQLDVALEAIEGCSPSGEGGALASQPEPSPPSKDSIRAERDNFEAAWDNFPLTLQLHYAALAMEEARDRLS